MRKLTSLYDEHRETPSKTVGAFKYARAKPSNGKNEKLKK